MALSFSRPDPSSPAAVGSAAFPVTKRGFDQGEVRDFLRMVAAELARLQEREKFLDAELRALQTRGMSAPGRLDEETVATLLGEEAARVLTAAREAATQIRDRAEEQATRLVKEAADDAARMREAAMTDAARIRDDAAADAESEIDLAKQQGRDMVNEAREYREKVLSELSRRREAARAQIEQLLHDRDRLTNAFERARIASEHVLGELHEAHEEPEFLVDLSPTTGPIPVISPEHPSVKPFDHEELADEVLEVAVDVDVDVAGDAEVIELTEIAETSTTDEADEEAMSIAEIEINDTAVIDVPVEEPAEPGHDSEHPVHAVPVVDDEVTTSTEPAQVEADVEVEEPVTNVVSLFGRGRKPDVVAPADEEVELADDRGDQPGETPQAPAHDRAGDIFAQLRAGSTESVATKANEAHGKKQPAKSKSVMAESTEVEPAPEPARTKSKKSKAPAVVPADPEVFAARNEALAALVTQMSRKLKRVLADEQNTVLAHLRQKRSSLEIDAIFGTADEQAARYAAAIGDDAMAAAGAGSAATKSAGGSARRVTQKAVVESLTSVIADGLVASFRDEARVAIGEAEGDRDVLAGLLRDVYRAWKSESLDAHVDHIACAAHARGAYLALDNAAIVAWMVDPSSPCCSECEDNSLAGGVTKGENFPTGHAHPPAHPGCRCLAGPVRH
jgi:DivIVA domain-containing protein